MSDDSKYSESKIKRRNERKNNCKHKKHDLSELFSIDSAFFDDSEYIRKRHNKNSHRKKDPIKLCPRLTEKLLTTAYKSKIIRFKMDEDPLQRRIYFLKFVESLEMIFSKYTETCEVITDYPK